MSNSLLSRACRKLSRACVALFVVATSCYDKQTEPQLATGVRLERSKRPASIRPEESFLFQIEEIAPGFGGFKVDESGNIHVWMKPPGKADLAVSAIRAAFSTQQLPRPVGAKFGSYIVHEGRYGISELAVWRDAIFDAMVEGHLPSAVSLDLDEGDNLIRLRVVDQNGVESARQLLQSLAVESDAVTIEVRCNTCTTLQRGAPI